MEPWMKAELNYVRVLRHPCLVSDLQTRDVSAWTRTQQWCHNRRCRAYGRTGEGSHSDPLAQKERRYQCKRCRRTFTETRDTALLPDAQAEVAGSSQW